MKKWIVAAMMSLLLANLALADISDRPIPCDAIAQDKSVPAESKIKAAKGCEKSRQKIHAYATCEKHADDRELRGKERMSFMQKCTGYAPAARK